jgi:hypothetical protein
MASEPRYAIQYVRLPERLKKRLDSYAKRQRVGRMNDHIILALDEYLTKYDAEPTPEPVAQ